MMRKILSACRLKKPIDYFRQDLKWLDEGPKPKHLAFRVIASLNGGRFY
jgi:hypothetical protein